MRRYCILLIASLMPLCGWAAGGAGVDLESAPIDLDDHASLQRGARLYMNYCMGCHSLQYERYEQVAEGAEIPHELVLEHLVFDDSKIGELMENAMPRDSAKRWFGAAPPDLTLVSRLRGNDWVYTYLKSFYTDPARPWGVNNLVFPDVGMPNVLLELQGEQRMVCKQVPQLADNGGVKRDPLTGEDITVEDCRQLDVAPNTGRLDAEGFDQVAADLTNFLAYVGEPAQQERRRLGIYVLLFVAFFFVVAYMLNREYWKDVH